MIRGYGRKRFQRKYSKDRSPAVSLKLMGPISKFLFIFNFSMTLLSLWVKSHLFLFFHDSIVLMCFGLTICTTGWYFLKKAFSDLGENYSPIFDAYLPKQLVTSGLYSKIRHPIYLFNLFISFGLAIMSGSGWVLLGALISFVLLMIGIEREEQYLTKAYGEYKAYSQSSWKLIPYIY